MEFYLPNEVWSLILKNLYLRDLLTFRLVSTQFNKETLFCLKERKVQVTIRNDTELVEYCEFLSHCGSRLHEIVNLNFVLYPISSVILKGSITNLAEKITKCTLNILIEKPNEHDFMQMEEKLNTIFKFLVKLRNLKIIADENTSTCKVCIPQLLHLQNLHLNILYGPHMNSTTEEEPFFFDSLMQVSPNIKSLILEGFEFSVKYCGYPLTFQLKKLSVQTFEFFIVPHPLPFFAICDTFLDRWLKNAPALEIFDHDSHFNMEATQYFKSIKHIKHAKPHLMFNQESFTLYYNDPNIVGRLVEIELVLIRIRHDLYDDIKKLLSSQTQSLEVLKLDAFGICNTLEFPMLKKLHTFAYYSKEDVKLGSILPFKTEIFPKLKFVTFINKNFKSHPFTGVYPTVEILKLNYLKNWQHIFPNVKSFTGYCRLYKELLLLDLNAKIQSLELCIKLSYKKNSEKDIWNILTGSARIENGNVFYMKGINDENKLPENEIIPTLPNLRILKVKDSCSVHVGAIAFITLHHGFKTFQKLEFHITEDMFQTIPKEFIQILRDNHNVIFDSTFHTVCIRF